MAFTFPEKTYASIDVSKNECNCPMKSSCFSTPMKKHNKNCELKTAEVSIKVLNPIGPSKELRKAQTIVKQDTTT